MGSCDCRQKLYTKEEYLRQCSISRKTFPLNHLKWGSLARYSTRILTKMVTFAYLYYTNPEKTPMAMRRQVNDGYLFIQPKQYSYLLYRWFLIPTTSHRLMWTRPNSGEVIRPSNEKWPNVWRQAKNLFENLFQFVVVLMLSTKFEHFPRLTLFMGNF